jgi:hypothetical protein
LILPIKEQQFLMAENGHPKKKPSEVMRRCCGKHDIFSMFRRQLAWHLPKPATEVVLKKFKKIKQSTDMAKGAA